MSSIRNTEKEVAGGETVGKSIRLGKRNGKIYILSAISISQEYSPLYLQQGNVHTTCTLRVHSYASRSDLLLLTGQIVD